ncbi:insulinase family protein [Candidatus Woesearchaeota archaeon]|nr:insulinase family protein [Candidatus Woesearchaeota archaeon]
MNDISYQELESGLKLYVLPSPSPVQLYQLFTPFGGDILRYCDQMDGKEMILEPGSAHYFEHVLFIMPPLGKDRKPVKWRTSTPKTKRNLRDGLTELKNNKAIVVNAYTWNDITNYWFAGRQNNLENLETMLDFVFTAYLPQDRFKKEVTTILDEARRSENDASTKQFNAWALQAYRNHGARYPVIGTLESIKRIALEDVLSIHSMFYRPSNMSLVVIGNVSADVVAERVSKKLTALGKGTYAPPPQEVLEKEPAEVAVADNFLSPVLRADIIRPNVIAGWKVIMQPSIDRHLAVMFAGQVLGGMGSKIRERLVSQGIDERTFGGEGHTFRDHGQIAVGADTNDPARFKELIMNTVDAAVRKGFPPEEIEYARNSLLTDEDSAADDILELGRRLVRWGVLTRNPRDYFTALRRTETITADDINAQLSDILNPEHLSFSLMVPEKK